MDTFGTLLLAASGLAVAAVVIWSVWYGPHVTARDKRLDARAVELHHTGELPRTFFAPEPIQPTPLAPAAVKPTIRRIVTELTTAIAQRQIEHVPTIAQLKVRYRASDYAVRRALAQLKASGLIENRGHPRGRHVLTAWARLFPDLVSISTPALTYVI